MRDAKPVGPYLIASLLVVSAGFLPLPLASNHDHGLSFDFLLLAFSGLLDLVWLAMLIVGFIKYRWRGMSLLLGAPIAVVAPAIFGAFVYECAHMACF